MSSPVSVKMAPPNYIDGRVRRRFLHIYLLQLWISLIPTAFMSYWVFSPIETKNSFLELVGRVWVMPEFVYFLIIPLWLAVIYIITISWTALVTKVRLGFLNLLHKPVEGVFYRSMKDKDYVYWNKRNYARLFLNWILNTIPSNIMRQFLSFRFLGVKIGPDTVTNHTWVSQEFVSLGKGVKLGQAVCIYSFMFEDDKLLVAHVEIGDGVFIGPQTVLYPGTKVGAGAIIDAGTWAHPFFEYKSEGVYHGCPAELIRMKSGSEPKKEDVVSEESEDR